MLSYRKINYHIGNLFFYIKGDSIKIQYHNNEVKKLCTDIKVAKKHLPGIVPEKLIALINFIESSENLQDINQMQIYHLHALHGKRQGQYAMDIGGRRTGYRMVIMPVEDCEIENGKDKLDIFYQSIEVISVWEVTNHYE